MRISGWHLQLGSSHRALAGSVHKDPAYRGFSNGAADSGAVLEIRQGALNVSPADGSWEVANKKALAANKSASHMLL